MEEVMRRIALASLALAMSLGVAGCSSSATNNQTPTVGTPPAAAASTASRSANVSIQNMAFGPDALSVPAGARVTWTNLDTVAHTVTFDSASISSSGTLANGASFSATFDSPGTFTYHCSIHPGMTGTVTVT
jgi:plastocyanin